MNKNGPAFILLNSYNTDNKTFSSLEPSPESGATRMIELLISVWCGFGMCPELC